MSRKSLVPIVLPADPAAAMEAATKQYVDSKAGGGGSARTVGYAAVVANQASMSTSVVVDVTGLTVTFTADPSKRYRTTAVGMFACTSGGSSATALLNSGTNVQVQAARIALPTSGLGMSYMVSLIETALTGSVTRKVAVQGNTGVGGTLTHVGNSAQPAYILVEDIT